MQTAYRDKTVLQYLHNIYTGEGRSACSGEQRAKLSKGAVLVRERNMVTSGKETKVKSLVQGFRNARLPLARVKRSDAGQLVFLSTEVLFKLCWLCSVCFWVQSYLNRNRTIRQVW